MSTFGETLRREREMRGVTLEEISETTKISTRLLKALESDQFSELPGGIFTRNFIRAYAQYLGLDEEHTLAEYKRAAGSPSDNDLTRLAQNRPLSNPTGARARLLPWLVIAILLGSGYAVYRYSHRTVEIKTTSVPATTQPPNASEISSSGSGTNSPAETNPSPSGNPSTSQNSNLPASAGANPAAGAAQPKEGQQAQQPGSSPAQGGTAGGNAAATAPALGEGDLLLQVSTSEDSWVAIAADGKTLWQHTLPANSTRLFRAKDFFDVTTGNAQGTGLSLNGQPQKALGREGEFKRIHLTRDNVQAQAPPQRPQ